MEEDKVEIVPASGIDIGICSKNFSLQNDIVLCVLLYSRALGSNCWKETEPLSHSHMRDAHFSVICSWPQTSLGGYC